MSLAKEAAVAVRLEKDAGLKEIAQRAKKKAVPLAAAGAIAAGTLVPGTASAGSVGEWIQKRPVIQRVVRGAKRGIKNVENRFQGVEDRIKARAERGRGVIGAIRGPTRIGGGTKPRLYSADNPPPWRQGRYAGMKEGLARQIYRLDQRTQQLGGRGQGTLRGGRLVVKK